MDETEEMDLLVENLVSQTEQKMLYKFLVMLKECEEKGEDIDALKAQIRLLITK